MFDRDSIRGFSALITLVGVASGLGFSFNAPAFSQATSNSLPLLLAQKSEKVRVAVLDFDYSGLSNP
ncbi:MAG: penicillin-binding protein activator LpoB, partial [Microcystis aeruginosa]